MSSSLDRAIAGHGLYTVFQPIVSLIDGAAVGYEALSRWPSLDAGAVFARANITNQAAELDYRCIEAAIESAATAGINPGAMLSINTEAAGPTLRQCDQQALTSCAQRYQIMFEVTERHLLKSPRSLLRHVDALRSDGYAIALDDVGVQRDSCALFDVIVPDVIKLDLGLVQHQPTPEQARTLTAVLAYREKHAPPSWPKASKPKNTSNRPSP
ncbi:EAL domain-containing protein [Mycobacterium simiae]|uniref:EAL domain-containing protein n=1 Tax=Mycobacterium simiae TaxID=1784 RepID=UPI0026157005|nr:EAL domain-containing protein [Mycobacterium simiae]